MDRGIWAIWYELPEDAAARAEYLDWFHREHIPEKLSRPGYVWAAHYELGHGGARFQKVVDGLVHAQDAGLGRGRGFLALFGGVTAHTFLDPSPAQLKERQGARGPLHPARGAGARRAIVDRARAAAARARAVLAGGRAAHLAVAVRK